MSISYQAVASLVAEFSVDGGRLNLVQLGGSARDAAQVLALGDFLHLTAHDEVGQADATEEFMDLLAQVTPQVVSQAGITGVAIPQALATGGIDRFVDRVDDLGHLDGFHASRQLVTAAWAANAGYQAAAAQLGEQLFQIREGNALALGNIGQRHRPLLRVQRQVKHGGHGVSAFGSQSHGVWVPRELQDVCEYAIPEHLSQL
ncbi:ESAT-6 protein secretion system EspG family protein [Pseudomonas soli]